MCLHEKLRELKDEFSRLAFFPEAALCFGCGGNQKQMDQKFSKEKNVILMDPEFMKQEVEALQDPQQRLVLKQLSY